MSWLETLDTRARLWPAAGRWAYLGLKWSLVALGGFAMVRLMLDRSGIWPM